MLREDRSRWRENAGHDRALHIVMLLGSPLANGKESFHEGV